MNTTDAAAWWGAVIATMVFIWDIIKWRKSGVRIQIRAIPNMQKLDSIASGHDNKKVIFVEAINSGHRPTTITHYVIYHYDSWLKWICGKTSRRGVVPASDFGLPLPYVLNPGERWTGGVMQKSLIEKMGTRGIVACGVIHCLSDKPILAKIALKGIT